LSNQMRIYIFMLMMLTAKGLFGSHSIHFPVLPVEKPANLVNFQVDWQSTMKYTPPIARSRLDAAIASDH
jgi:hypothetical protein